MAGGCCLVCGCGVFEKGCDVSADETNLQFALAVMLPDKVGRITSPIAGGGCFIWRETGKVVTDESWLHICWLIEQGMTGKERVTYMIELWHICSTNPDGFAVISAPWQLRAQAICKVRGVNLV